MKIENRCSWAVVATCESKNNGVIETYKNIIATFDYPFLATDYIEKCLPKENRDIFEVVSLDKIS